MVEHASIDIENRYRKLYMLFRPALKYRIATAKSSTVEDEIMVLSVSLCRIGWLLFNLSLRDCFCKGKVAPVQMQVVFDIRITTIA